MEAIDAELPISFGSIRIIRKSWAARIDSSGAQPHHHLELSLLPRSELARGSYPAHWGPHRFEPIGELFLIPGGEFMHAQSGCQHQNSIVLDFAPSILQRYFDCHLDWTSRRLQGCLDITSHDIRHLLFRIGEEARAPGLASHNMIELMAAQVVIELARYIQGLDEEKALGGLAPWRLRLIDERLANGLNPPNVAELAALCNISVRHLTRAFRISRGRSIGHYVLEHRMTQAKKLIEAGMSIKSVAGAMNFTASSNFTVAFRRATGETPREYKQRVNRNIQILGAASH